MNTRTIVIGDVHGCLDELQDLLKLVQPTDNDTCIFLGDLVNRGPDTPGVLRLARSLPRARFVIGNHELRLLKYRRTRDTRFLKNSDWNTIHRLNESDWNFLDSFEPWIYLESLDTVLVHGGFLPGTPWREQPLSILTHIQVLTPTGAPAKRASTPQGTPWAEHWQGPPFVLYGHTPFRTVQRRAWSLGIDTGCAMGGALTACILPQREIVQIPARRAYIQKTLPP